MSFAFAASLLFGGAIPSYAEENPDTGIEPVPFENVEAESTTVTEDVLPGTSTLVPIVCDGLTVLYLGSNEVVGQTVSASSSKLSLISATGTIFRNGKYYKAAVGASYSSKNASVTNKVPFSSGARYQQDGLHKFVTFSGKTGISYTSRSKTF